MADHHFEFAGLDDALELAVEQRQVVRPKGEVDGFLFTWRERDFFETPQLLHGRRDGADDVAQIELGHFGAGAISRVPDLRAYVDFSGGMDLRLFDAKIGVFKRGVT